MGVLRINRVSKAQQQSPQNEFGADVAPARKRHRSPQPARQRIAPQVIRGVLALTLVLAFVATVRVPGAGAALQVQITAEANFDGNFRPGEWVPVTIALANGGGAVTGDAVVESGPPGGNQARYSQRVELPPGSQKVLTIHARVDGGSSLTAYFEAGRDRATAPAISLRPSRTSQELVGVIADDAVAGEELRRALVNAYGTGRIEAVVFPPDQIPDNTFGLNSFSGLVIGDATTGRWSAEQRAALAQWVARGGTLVVTGGPNARKVAEGLGDLVPLRPRDSVTAPQITALGSGTLSGLWVLATGDLIPEATRAAEQNGVSLIVSRPWGRGSVTSLALDPGTGAFAAWSGATSFWTRFALDTPLPASLQAPFDQNHTATYQSVGGQPYRIANVLRDLPGLSLPPTWAVGLVLLLFIILIGPVNYLVLRRMDRRELAWVTIPALTIIFALGIYAYGAGTKGREITVNSVSIVRIAPEARAAEVQAFYGIFTPSRGTRDFSVATGAFFTGFTQYGFENGGELGGDVRFEQGANGGVRQASFAQWTQRTVAAQGAVDPAPLAIRAELRWVGPKLLGTVTNTTNRTIEDALLVYDNAYLNVGDLAPGASQAVDWTPVATSSGSSSYYRPGLGSTIYFSGSGGYYGGPRQSGALGVDGRRAEVLDSLTGIVLDYGTGPFTAPVPPYMPTNTPTNTPRPTATPRATPTTQGGTGTTTTSASSGPVQLLFWHPDTPLDLRINAGDRIATTLIIQELMPGTATQHGPAQVAAAGGAR